MRTRTHPDSEDEILRYPAVQEMTKLSRTTLWRLQRQGRFPKSFAVSPGIQGWLKSQITAWMQGRAESNAGEHP